MRRAGLAVEQGDGSPPWQPSARLPAEDVGLGGLFELHLGKSRIGPQALFFLQYFGRQCDLGLAERVERMIGICADRPLCRYHIGPSSHGLVAGYGGPRRGVFNETAPAGAGSAPSRATNPARRLGVIN